METKELIEALRNEDETDVHAMMDYMEMAADRLEGMQRRIFDLESAEPELLAAKMIIEPFGDVYVKIKIGWHGKISYLNVPVRREAVF